MVPAEDQLMEMLFRSYIMVTEPNGEQASLATCAACNTDIDRKTFRWCIQANITEIYKLGIDHIREQHRAVAVLTIDGMRQYSEQAGPTPQANLERHRLERLRLGLMVLRDQLAGVTRQHIVLNPLAMHALVLGLLATTKTLLAADRILASSPPAQVRMLVQREAADVR